MAANLLDRGFDLTVWNRTPEKALPLVRAGARGAATPAEAVEDADLVVTMLFDAPVTREVMETALGTMSSDAVWLQSGTVGVDGTKELAALADRHSVTMVDTPVLGTKKPAEDGTLVVLASGAPDALDRATPVLDAYSARIIRAGDLPGAASALKLACNAWVTTVTAGVAQSLALARAQGVDPTLFLEAISGGALDIAYAHVKGGAMLADDYTPSFDVSGALKDLDLIIGDARTHGVASGVVEAVRDLYGSAERAGHAEEDIAAVYEVIAARNQNT
jgi:3-hydroxyisobutyrate dehydrogenase